MFTYLILAIAQLSIAQDGLRDLLPFQGTTATFFSNTSSLDLASPLQLFRRQLQCEDPGYVPCADGLHCCLPTDDCYPELDMCCIKGGVTCGYHECYEEGATCCPDTGACLSTNNETCCNTASRSGCCRSGTSCCSEANACCLEGETCCAESCCSSGTECKNGQCVSPVPVLELPYTPLVLDETVKNMCLWIRDQNQANPNEIELTYSIVRNDGGKCKGCCKNVAVPQGREYEGEKTTCDEAPFAKTYEALNSGAHLACVDWYENSFQGWWFGQWSRYTRATVPGFKDGSKFIVRITGLECSTVKESDLQGCGSSGTPNPTPRLLIKRDDRSTPTSGSETRVIPSSVANSTNNLVIVPFGDLEAGTYSMQAKLSGSVANASLWDNMGDEVDGSTRATADDITSGNSFEFTVLDSAIGAALLIETQQKEVNVTWNFRPASSTTSSVTTGQTSTNSQLPPSTAPNRPSSAVALVLMPGSALLVPLAGLLLLLV
ncbi:hypothetical protein BU26DRAFT_599248 [Trematosphaeria pertusa]|uniref:Deoxyribonuclease NucA/NucB domain-containing protein n=1 Tax=Trematosphaeria pertusa TaxID=390896 RepID=A0A6A6J2F7_9PLEO|nr:uncharacterized protein BU26DRAFT_599248 [Trematosphaeria pertusa]KAF2256581.1 hypothetical protein BU26DRAFT_599248 [Trematosphaeria pertusa]